MKVLVIPDVHLKPMLFLDALEIMKKGIADQAVCLMDIPDDWGKGNALDLYAQTFDCAIAFAKAYPKSLWCYGNHDISYVLRQSESGYSYAAAGLVGMKIRELQEVLTEDNPISYVQRIDRVLFCHGGLNRYFVEEQIGEAKMGIGEVVQRINQLPMETMWNQYSPIWYRPQGRRFACLYEEDSLLQVVGHTPVSHIIKEGNLISCDVFSTTSDGNPIGTQEFLLLDTETWEYQGIKSW